MFKYIHNIAFKYLLEKYGYKLRVMKPEIVKRLEQVKSEHVREYMIDDETNYFYLLDDSNLEDTDALVFVLLNEQKNKNAVRDLHNLLVTLKIIENESNNRNSLVNSA